MKTLISKWRSFYKARCQPLPVVTTPYRAALEKTQRQYFWVLVCGLIGLGYYSYVFHQAHTKANTLVRLVSAKTDLTYPHVLTSSDLTWVEIPQKWVPSAGFTKAEDLVGKTLRRHLAANEIVVKADIALYQDPDSITAQFKENYAFTVGEDWLVAKLPALSRGDLIDVLVTNPKLLTDNTTTLVSRVRVLQVESQGGRKNLVLNLNPAQAQALLFSRGLRLPMQILVHSPELSDTTF